MSMDMPSLSFDFRELLQQCKPSHDAPKRLFDLLFSLSVLVLFFPLFLLIGCLVRFSSKGRVLFSHERIGRGGKPFACWKFRTMYPDAEKRLKELLSTHPELQEEWNKNHKLKNDPRITPIGKILRKSSLDEIPQFWNVLKGDLSVVGPRPVIKEELLRFYGNKTPLILSVRPGLTGLWQVSGRSNISYAERVLMDADYVTNRNFFKDLLLVLKTIPAMIFSRGAY